MRLNEKQHLIWTNDIDIEDWRDDILELYPDDDLTDEHVYDLAMQENAVNLECERANLDIELNREIIAIGDLGLWYGRSQGYKEIGTNVHDCFDHTCGDYVTWYVDENGDFRCQDIHHDGTNYYLYRVFRKGLDFWQKQNFLDKLYRGAATRRDVNRYTERLGDAIANVYGFKIRKLPRRKVSA